MYYLLIFFYFVFWIIYTTIYNWFSLLIFYIGLGLLILSICLLYFLKNPTEALFPYNWLIESLNEKKVFYSDIEKEKIFPTSKELENNWTAIRDEFLKIKNNIQDENIGKRFIQQTDDFWKGWNTFELRSFNKDNLENMEKCPTMSRILKDHPEITTAFFSILSPGKTISSHYGPFKGILRYHLGLIVPKNYKDCFISVDNQIYEWREGECVLFDETYKHFVKNETDEYRVVLFLDIKRPSKFPIIQDFLFYLMSISPYN